VLRTGVLAAAVALAAPAAPAAAFADVAVAAEAHAPARRTLVYGELLGKGGPYGLGVERAITPRLAIGAVVSAAVLRDQQLYTLAPYLHVTIGRRGRHALFGELGGMVVHSHVPSPVPAWDGTSDTGGGGVATLGWERAGDRLVVRAYGAVMVGEGGIAPWLGVAIGVRL
jgi:hypothetical protein